EVAAQPRRPGIAAAVLCGKRIDVLHAEIIGNVVTGPNHCSGGREGHDVAHAHARMRNHLKAPAGLRPGWRKLPLSIELERQPGLRPELIVPTLWLDPISDSMPPPLGRFSEGVRSNQPYIK